MPKILLCDTLYPDFIRTVPIDPNAGYDENLQRVLARGFGTADFYSRHLRALGWDAVDVIANHDELQQKWARESEYWNGYAFDVLGAQIEDSEPDVVFLQDLSLAAGPISMTYRIGDCLLAGQLSCPWPGDDIVRQFHILFSSFPHYIERIQKLGVRAIYNPLAFEDKVLHDLTHGPEEMGSWWYAPPDRIHDVVFIGGVGNPSHWKYGMEVLEAVAREIPTFKWWGYGVRELPADSALRSKYQGEAYGIDMYEILLQSTICLNRHGEVAEGYANNMRLFESTGCGALLLTERSPNLSKFFSLEEVVRYSSPKEAVWMVRYFLEHDAARRKIAAAGQKRTLKDHTYAQRMKVVSETLKEMMVNA